MKYSIYLFSITPSLPLHLVYICQCVLQVLLLYYYKYIAYKVKIKNNRVFVKYIVCTSGNKSQRKGLVVLVHIDSNEPKTIVKHLSMHKFSLGSIYKI